MSWWPAQERHLRSRPPADGLAAMARDVWPGSRAVLERRLKGGLGASVHLVRLVRGRRTREVVLKRFRLQDDAPRIEWERTVHAASLPVTTPEPIAEDLAGSWFGAPSFVLGRVPGRPILRFGKPGTRFERIAEAMLLIASAPREGCPAVVRRPRPTWEPPSGLRTSPLAERTIAAIGPLAERAYRRRTVMSHGDPHPGNMLWSQSHVAFIDWRSGSFLPPTHDVVYCRLELTVLDGVPSGERFLDAYERVAGREPDDVPTWDLVLGLNAMRWVPWWVHAYREHGRTDLTVPLARRRVRSFVRRALATCSS